MSVAIFDAGGDYGAVIVSGSNLTLGEERQSRPASDAMAQTAVLLLQNEVPEAANIAAARAVKAQGGRVVLNAARRGKLSDELIALVDILVVNAIEAEFLAGHGGGRNARTRLRKPRGFWSISARQQSSRRAAKVSPVAAGPMQAFALPAIPVKVVSTHGAGDEFVGALAAALARGEAMRAAVTAANAASALLVSTPEAERDGI